MTPEAKQALESLACALAPICESGACIFGKHGCCDRVFCDAVRRGVTKLGYDVEWREDQRLPYMGPEGCRVPPHLRPACSWYVCADDKLEDIQKAAVAYLAGPAPVDASEIERLTELAQADLEVQGLMDQFGEPRVQKETVDKAACEEAKAKLKGAPGAQG